ncbi:MAG: glycerol-3-phosphate dehydrogenase/oxidase [Phormidesmis sp.]
MQRNLKALSDQSFDLLVIGGGIHGACIAWEATLRGLSVALVEQSDFASGTSANSLKVIHGGLRYLQTADFRRMRQSIRARQTLMRIAPHLVHPMPVLIPTYGHSIKGKEAMAVALRMNDLISCDRNLSLTDPQKHIPAGKILSQEACLEKLPDLPTEDLTGAALFHDAQVYNSEQLVLAFLQSAAQRGAQIANYTRAVGFVRKGDRVTATTAEDQLTGDRFTIQAKAVINASGPWIDQMIATATDAPRSQPLAKAMNLVTRPLFAPQLDYAVGITSRAPGSRLFFIAPWRGCSLIGTWYGHDTERVKPPTAKTSEIESFLTDVNQAYPSFNLTTDDVRWVHTGLLPSLGTTSKSGEVNLTKHFQLKDHRSDGLAGLLSVTGVKYTTALDIARRAVDWVFRTGVPSTKNRPSTSHREPLYGGRIEQFQTFLDSGIRAHRQTIPAQTIRRLIYNYGTAYPEVLEQLDPLPAGPISADRIGETASSVVAAEVRYNLKSTMPQTLEDMIFRRTELGAAGHPGNEVLQLCSQIMSDALNWSPDRQSTEVEQVQQKFGRWQVQPQSEPQRSPDSTASFPPCPV